MNALSKLINLEDDLCCDWKKYYKEMPELFKYKQRDLKYICKKNQLHVTGNKSILVERILQKYKKEKASSLIQSVARRKIVQTYILLHGPAYKDKKCTNDTDFYTLEPFENIHIKDFFSFKDTDGFLFGFDFNSIYTLIKRNKKVTNPYNRNEIPKNIIRNIKRIRKLNRVYYPKTNDVENILNANASNIVEMPQALTALDRVRSNKTFNERVSNLFYEIDQVGNYTTPEWLSQLGRDKLVSFIRFIYQFWNHRAGISGETKQNICPHFNPFNYQGITTNFSNTMTLERAQNMTITICENLFYTAINVEYKKLSAIYILTALTTVSNDARRNIPWLYESTL